MVIYLWYKQHERDHGSKKVYEVWIERVEHRSNLKDVGVFFQPNQVGLLIFFLKFGFVCKKETILLKKKFLT